MDFTFTKEQEEFRQEVRDFLQKELPPDWGGMDYFAATDEDHAFGLEFDRKLAKKGWLTLAWPKEYGGQARTHVEQLIFNELKGYYRAPTGGMHGVNLVGPTLMVHGTEEQKKLHLPPIARADLIWCQGFSEPTAGSDLASLVCSAVEDGDDYVINGQKIFTTNGHYAEWCILLGRTDTEAPKHRGISYFLMDMRSPGVTVQPLWIMSGGRVNRVFMENVRISKRNLVGEKNRGWYVAMTTLNVERSGIDRVAESKRTLDELVEYANEMRRNGQALAEEPLARTRLAELAIEIEVARMLSYRIACMQEQGQPTSHEGSMSKLFTTELAQKVANTGMQMMGLYGPLQEGSKWAHLKGRIEHAYKAAIGGTILAGSSEVQRLIIATRGLGLPRD